MAKGLLFASFDFSGAHEDEFHDWYDLEHVPERQRVPGFLACERWIGDENPKIAVATYDLETVSMNVDPVAEHEFNEWYNTEHLPQLAAVPGVLLARRYRASVGERKYLALYNLTAPDVSRSDAWRKAAGTPWTERMRPHFRDFLRLSCKRYVRAGS